MKVRVRGENEMIRTNVLAAYRFVHPQRHSHQTPMIPRTRGGVVLFFVREKDMCTGKIGVQVPSL